MRIYSLSYTVCNSVTLNLHGMKDTGYKAESQTLPTLRLTSTFPSCCKYSYIQSVPKRVDHYYPSNYRHNGPVALLYSLAKAFETILNKHLQCTYIQSFI